MSTNLLLLLGPDFYRLNSSLQEEIYKELFHYLYGPVMQLIRDHAATEDIIQETFLTALKRPPKVGSEQQLRAWIRVVAKNNTINYLRKQRLHGNVSLDTVLSRSRVPLPSPQSVEREAELNSLTEHIHSYMGEMKPDQREILELSWKKGLSNKEIAAETKDTENGVRVKLHRARVSLKKKLQRDWGRTK